MDFKDKQFFKFLEIAEGISHLYYKGKRYTLEEIKEIKKMIESE